MCVCIYRLSAAARVVSPVGVIPRFSGTAPADMGTAQWITQGREGFTGERSMEVGTGQKEGEQRVS